jgi:Enoyl-(Acyl carrier protein) reductase
VANISSINGQKGQVGQTNYTASKSGDIGFTKSLAQENASKGITGYIATDMVKAVPKEVLEKSVLPLIPVRRLGEPEEVARCVVFLVSEVRLHHRFDTNHQRRAIYDLIFSPKPASSSRLPQSQSNTLKEIGSRFDAFAKEPARGSTLVLARRRGRLSRDRTLPAMRWIALVDLSG